MSHIAVVVEYSRRSKHAQKKNTLYGIIETEYIEKEKKREEKMFNRIGML